MTKQARELETPTFKRDLVGKLPANFPYFFHTGTVSEREKREESVSEICVVVVVTME